MAAPGTTGTPVGKKPASGLRIVAIVAAVVFGVIGVGCTGLVGVVMLGRNAETTFTPVDGQRGGDPDPSAERRRTTREAAERECDRLEDAGGMRGNQGFDPADTEGRDEYAVVMQKDIHSTSAWLAGVDLVSGSVVADSEGEWNDDMERRSTVAICVSSALPVPSIECYDDAAGVTWNWRRTVWNIRVLALATGEVMGRGEIFSAPADCPARKMYVEFERVPAEFAMVEQWAAEHISNGQVR